VEIAGWQSTEMSTVKYNSQYIITDVATVKFIEQWIIAGNCCTNLNQASML